MNLFTIAGQGALAAQNQLSVTASNIANQQTAGYSRQEMTQQALATANIGSGVQTSDASRITNQNINQALWHSQTSLGYYQSQDSWGSALEKVISASSSQPNGLLQGFFNSLSALTNQPDSTAYRQQLLSSASSLATGLSQTSQALAAQQQSLLSQQSQTVTQINQLSAQIANLNKEISRLGPGSQSNSLQDQRDQQVKTLSGLISVSLQPTSDGSYQLTLDDGSKLVDGNQAGVLSATHDASGKTSLELSFGHESAKSVDKVGGELGGMIDYQQQVLAPLVSQTTSLMQDIAQQVNDQLSKGYDLQGQPGKPLFEVAADSHGVMQMNTTDLSASALALSGQADAPANGDNLTALLALKNSRPGGGGLPLGEQSSAITNSLAQTNNQISSQLTTASAVNQQWQFKRDNLSAVNKDEEAINLQTYSQSYQANMKVLAVGNQLFSELLTIFS